MHHIMPWMAILATTLPLVALSTSYRRIIEQKMKEAERRLLAYAEEYGRAYGVSAGGAKDELQQELREFHNWRTYTVPMLLTGAAACCTAAFALTQVHVGLGIDPGLEGMMATTTPSVTIAAGGAYLWGLNDLIKRHRSADLSSSAIHVTWLRMVISAAVGALLGMMFRAPIDLIAAFAIGGLPIDDIKQFVMSRVDFRLDRGKVREADLFLVQGISRSMRDRLSDENIESVQTLAFADPVRLLFRTNIEWNVVLDWIDQAMLINFVGEGIEQMRTSVGVRGAIELASLCVQLEGKDPEETKTATQVLERAGAVLGGIDVAKHVAYQLRHDPLVQFVWTHWDAARPGAAEFDAAYGPEDGQPGVGDDDGIVVPSDRRAVDGPSPTPRWA